MMRVIRVSLANLHRPITTIYSSVATKQKLAKKKSPKNYINLVYIPRLSSSSPQLLIMKCIIIILFWTQILVFIFWYPYKNLVCPHDGHIPDSIFFSIRSIPSSDLALHKNIKYSRLANQIPRIHHNVKNISQTIFNKYASLLLRVMTLFVIGILHSIRCNVTWYDRYVTG